jgi:hypothetical protein
MHGSVGIQGVDQRKASEQMFSLDVVLFLESTVHFHRRGLRDAGVREDDGRA